MQPPSSAHPPDSVLQALALGLLEESKVDGVMEHLKDCSGCRSVVVGQASDDFLALVREAHEAGARHWPTRAGDGRTRDETLLQSGHTTPPELTGHPQYEVLRELGHGGMGVVYLVRNRFLAREEVIKVLNEEVLVRAGGKERFLREIQLAARLNHPNVVTAYTALQLGETLAFAMEYVKGQDLAKLVKAHGPLPVPNACHYARQVALGLQHAHDKHMVHRDIKPQNLILTREGKRHIVKILDFGLAKVLCEHAEDSSLTIPGKALGTPDYIAPEQSLDASRADIRADLYSLGCTLYFLLAGRPPYRGKNPFATMRAHHLEKAQPLHRVRKDVPEALAAVVAKLMAKNPLERLQTPDEVAQALLPFVRADASAQGHASSAATWLTPEKALAQLRTLLGNRLGRLKSPTLLGLGLSVLLLIVVVGLVIGRGLLKGHPRHTDGFSGPEVTEISAPPAPPGGPARDEQIKALLGAYKTTYGGVADWGGKELVLLQGLLLQLPEGLADWLVALVPATQLEKEPLSVPAAAAVQLARARIQARQPDARANPALAATRLLREVSTSKEAVERFALLCEARDLAADAVNMDLAMQVIQEMARRFQIDALQETAYALQRAGTAIDATPRRNADLAHRTLDAIAQAVAIDDYATALGLLNVVKNVAPRARDKKIDSEYKKLAQRLPVLSAAYERIVSKVKADNPDEPTLNKAVGYFQCFYKKNWEKGLTLLARSNDPALSSLAQRERQGAETARARVELGDEWRKFATHVEDDVKMIARRKAYDWYVLALFELDGKEETRVRKFMTDLEKTVPGLHETRWARLDISQAENHKDWLLVKPGKSIATKREYTGPILVKMYVRTDKHSMQLQASPGAVFSFQGVAVQQIVLGEEISKASGPLPPGRWRHIHWLISENGMAVWADGVLLSSQPRNLDLSHKAPVRFFSRDSTASVQSLDVSVAPADIQIGDSSMSDDAVGRLQGLVPAHIRLGGYLGRGMRRPGSGGGTTPPDQGKGQTSPPGN